MSPNPALVERFAGDLEALIGANEARVGLAISGGADSLALLLLARAAFPGRVEAATVDHGLRAEAAAEAAMVASICEDLGVPHATLVVRVAPGGDGLQANARHARYAALGAWTEARGLPFLLTGHHADDQAETLLMRLARGSGVAGLAGVRARTSVPGKPGTLIRPLLGWRRAELAAVVAAAGLPPADDPSNRDPAFDRARLRARLAEAPWLDPEPLARTAANLAQAEDALAWAADRLWAERARATADGWTLDARQVPPELTRRLLSRALAAIVPGAAPRGEELARLGQTLAKGRTATLAEVLCQADGPCWRFSPAPPRRP